MNEFNNFINQVLNNRGINEDDKNELKEEMFDHLMLLKLEYIDKDFSEKDSIKLAIKDFGDSNLVGNDIKRNLALLNKAREMNSKDFIKCISIMFMSYYLYIFLNVVVFEESSKSIILNIGLAIVPLLISFIYVNININNKNKIRSLVYNFCIFFISEKIIMFIFGLIIINVENKKISIIEFIKSPYMFNKEYIICYIFFSIILILLCKYLNHKNVFNVRYVYNPSIKMVSLLLISVMFMITYYLLPNRFYFFRKLLENIIKNDIFKVDKNLLYMTINNHICIPNIGLILLVILFLKVIRYIKVKQVDSMY